MTIFPPQKIQTYFIGPNKSPFNEKIEYQFIGSGGDYIVGGYNKSSILFGRLLLQYLILAGAGFAIYLLASQKEKNVADE